MNRSHKVFYSDESGFSTAGVALALIITLSLIFSAARVYEINTQSAAIQEVADSAVLAAENCVGDFYVIANLCDAVILSLSLSTLVTAGIGIACACTPATLPLSKTFLDASEKIKKSRDAFSDKAIAFLNKYQEVLPFIATAKSSQVIAANTLIDKTNYTGAAFLVPWTGEKIESVHYESADAAQEEAQNNADDIALLGQEAEEKARQANEWKKLAYAHDSGSETDYCLYERAKTLAQISGSDNPFCSTYETWSFSIALERSKHYYRQRYEREKPLNNSVSEQLNSALRKRFYAYAQSEVNKGYVHETQDSFEAYFPRLPKNTEEMKRTELYTEVRYCVSNHGSGQIVHGYDECPTLVSEGSVGKVSISQLDQGNYITCPSCGFRVSSMGKVAAASSNIENGYEYHYNIVAEAAEHYSEAKKALSTQSSQLKDKTEGVFDALLNALKELSGKRISVDPPGRAGAISLVCANTAPTSNFNSLFVDQGEQLKSRVALSASKLFREETEESETVITSLLEKMAKGDGASVWSGPQLVLQVWSDILVGYGKGQETFSKGIEECLSKIHFASESGLASWAAESFESLMRTIGLEPSDLSLKKAILSNSAVVLSEDDSSFSAKLLDVKRTVLSTNQPANPFSFLLSAADNKISENAENFEGAITLATIEIVDGVSIPITITLPDWVKYGTEEALHNAISEIQEQVLSLSGRREWE